MEEMDRFAVINLGSAALGSHKENAGFNCRNFDCLPSADSVEFL